MWSLPFVIRDKQHYVCSENALYKGSMQRFWEEEDDINFEDFRSFFR